MKNKTKPRKKRVSNRTKAKTETKNLPDNPNPEPQASVPSNRPPFQETWKSELETENKPVAKKYGLLKKITNLILRIDPKISSGDLIPKGEISAARQKMESELGEKLTDLRVGNSLPTSNLSNKENIPKKSNKKQKNEAGNNKGLSNEKSLLRIKELLPQLKDSDLNRVLSSLPSSDYSSIINKVSTLGYPDYDQFYSALGDEICGFLNDLKSSLNYRISVLRKNGGDDDATELDLMSVPLKIKIFKSSLSKVDFDKIMSILNSVSGRVKLQENKLTEEKSKPDEFAEEQPEKTNPTLVLPVPISEPTVSPEQIHTPKKKGSNKAKKKKSKSKPKKKSKR